MKRVLLVVLLGLSEMAMAGNGFAAERDPYASIHSVAVVSAIGDSLDIQTRGLTAFNGEQGQLPIADWGIDHWMVESLSSTLATRFEVKQVDVDKAALAKCDVHRGCPGMFKRDSGVDAFVVARKREGSGPMGTFASVGLYFARVITSKYNLTVHADYIIEVIDAKSGTVLGSGSNGQTAIFFTTNDWPNTWDELTVAQRGQLEELIADIIEKSLPSALLDARLPALRSSKRRILAPANNAEVANSLAKIRTVAIVSGLGDQIHFVNPGNAFVSRIQSQTAPPASWEIDKEIEGVVRSTLAPHYKVENVALDRGAVARMALNRGSAPPSVALPPSDVVDAYVVIAKASADEGLYAGLGLRNWTPLFNHETAVYANYEIMLVDAKTLTTLAHYPVKYGEKHPCPAPHVYATGLPECVVNEQIWPQTPDKLTQGSAEVIRQRLSEIFSITIPETLLQFGWD